MNLQTGVGFIDPYVQFLAADGSPVSLGTLEIFLANTTTHLTTYSDQGLSSANQNPLTLDAGGGCTLYFAPTNVTTTEGISAKYTLRDSVGATIRTVDFVTLPVATAAGNLTTAVIGYGAITTVTIAGGSITPVFNRHLVAPEGGSADNLDTIAISGLPDGAPLVISNSSGSAAITVRSGIGNISLVGAASCILASTTDHLVVMRRSSQWEEVSRQLAASIGTTVDNTQASGRLTLTSGSPITTTDVTAATTVYYSPFIGNTIALYDGVSVWNVLSFSELSIAVPATTATPYDVFAYNNSGVAALELTAWTNTTTRATGLTRQNGVAVKSGATTRRYLGSFCTTGVSGQTEDSLVKRYVWNVVNKAARPLFRNDSTDTWAYSTATYRQANGAAANQVETMIGIAQDAVSLDLYALVSSSSATQLVYVAIGQNSTTTPATGGIGYASGTSGAADFVMPHAHLRTIPAVGITAWVWLERGSGTGTETWQGDGGAATLIQSGLTGIVMG
jgi:hypothetical protein